MPFLVYSLLRLVLVAAVIGVLWFVGIRHWLALAGFGAVISAALSYLLLQGRRDAATTYLAERAEARKQTGEDEEFEDGLGPVEHR